MPIKKVIEDGEMKTVEEVEVVGSTSSTKVSLVSQLTSELIDNPKLAWELVQSLRKITKPWEIMGKDGGSVNEMPVPPGKSAKEYLKETVQHGWISGYRLTTIFGEEVATIVKDSPKWKVTVLGEYQVDAPFIQHGQKGEASVKAFAEEKITKLGYVIGS